MYQSIAVEKASKKAVDCVIYSDNKYKVKVKRRRFKIIKIN